ncbi:MAG: TonB-linked SusC/RagA family outer membrane protein [Bacteroidia bacterium]|jgi:TonB-linked SusC/RagA family outer membrane protein
MNPKIIQIIKMISKYSLYAFMLQCLFMSMVLASGAKAQYKSVKEVTLSINAGKMTLSDVFDQIESATDYTFYFHKKDIKKKQLIDLPRKKQRTVAQVLEDVSRQASLKFKQVNNNISVSVLKKDEGNEPVVVVLVDVDISGKITDENGEGLPGASVVMKGTTNGSTTDLGGNYKLSVPEDATVAISFVGYETQEIIVGAQSTINVQLVLDATQLEELVVVGYGTVRKSDLTGAVSSVSGSDLAETASSNVLDQAQGRLAGVDIVKSNGSPGASSVIRIRGNRSISAGNNPLFVIDGIPTTQGIDDFNPGDIESMEVLKDASSVAIYGSRGANGVILITTKRGKQGKTKVSYNTYHGVKKAFENIDKMNGQQYAEFVRVANGLAKNDASQDVNNLGQQLSDNLQNGIETDWLDEILQTGTQQEHQVAVSGGTKDVNYYVSGSYYTEEGLVKKSDFERYSLRTNIDANLSKKAKMGISLTASTNLRNQMSNAPYTNAIRYSPLVKPFDADGNIIAFPNPSEGLVTSPLLEYAPNQHVDETKGYRFFSNLFGEYAITKYLTYRLNIGADFISSRRGRFSGDYDGSSSTGSIDRTSIFSNTIENILTYDKGFGDHDLNVVGLFSRQTNSTEVSGLDGRDIPITSSTFNDLGSSAAITGVNSGLEEWGLLSYMARINYRFKDRYLLTLSGRSDGSSRLAEGNKWAFFPAVSAGWILSEEEFMGAEALSFLKFRVGYGQVGNTAIDPYQTLGGLSRSTYAFGNDGAFGFGQSGIANPDLSWEISKTINIGIDFGLWNDRISGTIELYDTKTNDLLLERLIPVTSGFNSVLENVGSTRNRGWELSLSANVINNSDGLKWDVGLNIFSNKEEITELFNGATDDIGNNWFIGNPIRVFYNHQFDGIWQIDEASKAIENGQNPGEIKIADVNGRDGDGVLANQPDGKINSDDRTILGSTVPDWSGGLTNKITYKGLDFSMLIYSRQGQFLNSSLHNIGGNAWEGRHANLNFDYWTPDNPSNEIPIPKQGGQPLYSSAVRYHDGSFVKIKNITLGYDLARDLIKLKEISSMRVYFSAVNPVTFSKFDIVDPESSSGNVGLSTPLSSSTYIVGINLKF